jgi:hypothetical protein
MSQQEKQVIAATRRGRGVRPSFPKQKGVDELGKYAACLGEF